MTSLREQLQAAAQEMGVPVKDILALAPKNDPFWTGTCTQVAMAEWFAGEFSGYPSGVHLRRMHYALMSRPGAQMHDGSPYENTIECWQYMMEAGKYARYLGLVELGDFEDHKAPAPFLRASYCQSQAIGEAVEDFIAEISFIPINAHQLQAYHLEVWIEKSTMQDVLEPIARRYQANIIIGEGELSITSVNPMLFRRILEADRPVRIFYVSDFDPQGTNMPVSISRKIEFFNYHRDPPFDIKLKHILLTRDQVRKYQLPRKPIKATNKLKGRFEDRFGEGAVELDALEALHPGVFGSILRSELEPYFDDEKNGEAAEANNQFGDLEASIRSAIRNVWTDYRDEVPDQDIAPSGLEVDEDPDDWLYDSTREYFGQLQFYKNHRGEDNEE